jgi:hypothetical protein
MGTTKGREQDRHAKEKKTSGKSAVAVAVAVA